MLPPSIPVHDSTVITPSRKPTSFVEEFSNLSLKSSLPCSRPESRATIYRDPRPLRPIHFILKDPDLFLFDVSDSRVSVIEASVDPKDSRLSFTLFCCLKNHVSNRTLTLHRSLDQIAWLHNELHRAKPGMALGLPHSLLANLICTRTEASDLEMSLEAKRFQVERYLTRIMARPDIFSLEPWEIFLSPSMGKDFAMPTGKGLFERIKALSLNLFAQGNEDGISPLPKIKAEASIDDAILLEIDEFQEKRLFIVSCEAAFMASHQAILKLQSSREKLSSSLSRLGDTAIGALHSRHRLGPLIKLENRYKFRRFDAQLETIATLFDDLGAISHRQGQADANKLGSIFEEYTETLATLKTTFNRSVGAWSELLKPNQASAEKDYNASSFRSSRDRLKGEFEQFHQFKARDTRKVLQRYAHLQLNIERAKLNVLRAGLASNSNVIPVSLSSSSTSFGTSSSSLSPT